MRNKHSFQSDPNSFRTKHGDKFHIIYGSRVNPDNTVSLHEVSRENIQDKINSHAVETDMAIILARLKNGDTSVLTHKQPLYGDFTQFPKSYAEAFDLVKRSEAAFDVLPANVRQSFDNDVSEWFGAIGTQSWIDRMGFNPSESSPVSEVSSDE